MYTLDYTSNGPQVLTFGLPEEEHGRETEEAPVDEPLEEDSIIELADALGIPVEESESPTLSEAGASDHSSMESTIIENDPGHPPNELLFHAQMYLAGQRFGISSLCDIAKIKLSKRLKLGPWQAEMIPCIREIYRQGSPAGMDATNAGSLKDGIVQSARCRFRALKMVEGWDDLVIDFPEFAAALLKRF